MKFIGKKIGSGPMVRDVSRNVGTHVRKIGGGKKATSLKTTLACGHGPSTGETIGPVPGHARSCGRCSGSTRERTGSGRQGPRTEGQPFFHCHTNPLTAPASITRTPRTQRTVGSGTVRVMNTVIATAARTGTQNLQWTRKSSSSNKASTSSRRLAGTLSHANLAPALSAPSAEACASCHPC